MGLLDQLAAGLRVQTLGQFDPEGDGEREALALLADADLRVTAASLTSTFACRPTRPRALPKQAAYPAANSCSGLVPWPFPPISTGTPSARSSVPSELTVRPSRPWVAVAAAV